MLTSYVIYIYNWSIWVVDIKNEQRLSVANRWIWLVYLIEVEKEQLNSFK